ncbi:MAG: oxygenase MpaB family protein [Chloroflexota bacterium]
MDATAPFLWRRPASPAGRREPTAHPRDGLAGPESVAWKINSEVVLLLGWGPAILLQFAHPLVAAGVAEHSRFLSEPKGRLRRLRHTLRAMLALTFGTREQVAQAARGINAIHDRVHGSLSKPAGPFPAGHGYSAHDPSLLRWVHATLLDTFPRVYELYVGPLSQEEKDRYCAEASGIEALLGIPDGYLPRSTAELRAYMNAMYASGEIAVDATARNLADEIIHPPLPRVAGPLLGLAQLPTIGLLPPPIRESYGFTWGRRRDAALHHSARLIRRLVNLAPPALRYWPPARRRSTAT